MSKTLERRKHPRKQVAVQSRIAGEEVSAECETVDLSANGLSCWLDRPLSPFVRVKITLMLPSLAHSGNSHNSLKAVECEGVVVRSDKEGHSPGGPRYHTAIFFNHIGDDAMELIQRYVLSHKH